MHLVALLANLAIQSTAIISLHDHHSLLKAADYTIELIITDMRTTKLNLSLCILVISLIRLHAKVKPHVYVHV